MELHAHTRAIRRRQVSQTNVQNKEDNEKYQEKQSVIIFSTHYLQHDQKCTGAWRVKKKEMQCSLANRMNFTLPNETGQQLSFT